MKKVLMISNPLLLPPNGIDPGSVSFVGSLRNYGWEPVVLTRETPSRDYTDGVSGAEIPEGVDIYRTNPWEPGELPGLLGRAGSRLAELFLAPDEKRLWEIFTRRKAARIVRFEGIDLIYTTSPSKSTHLLGACLKRKYPQIPWVADIRAEIPVKAVNEAVRHSSFKTAVEKRTDRRTYGLADCVITDSESIRNTILKDYGVHDIAGRCIVVKGAYTEELSGIFEKVCRLLASKRLIA